MTTIKLPFGTVNVGPLSTLLPTSTPIPSETPAPKNILNVGLLVGLSFGAATLVLIMIVLVCVIIVRMRKKRTHSIDEPSTPDRSTHNVIFNSISKVRSLKHVRPKTGNALSINKNAGEEQNRAEVVNRGYMLASSEPHTHNRIKGTNSDKGSAVDLLSPTNPREENDGYRDSRYSELQFNTGLQGSESIDINENIAYNLDEDDIATLNTALGSKFEGEHLGCHIHMADPLPQQLKKEAKAQSKPGHIIASGLLEESAKYDYPNNFLSPGGDDKTDGKHRSIIFDVPNVKKGAHWHPQHPADTTNHSSEQEVLYQNQQGIYYNQTSQRESAEEAIYGNQVVEDPDETIYYNQQDTI